MEGSLIWLLAAVLLAVGEVLTVSFFLLPFAIGAGAAAVAAALGADPTTSVLVCAAGTGASFAFVRPVARRHLRQPPALRTGTAALVGHSAIVLEEVSDRAGTVKLDGEVWTARPLDEDAVIAPGTRVEVVEIQGATALVTE